MFGFKKKSTASAATSPTHPSAEGGLNPSKRTSSEPILITPNHDTGREYKAPTKEQRNKFKKGFEDSGGLENQSTQELEQYAVYKAEETTSTVTNCLRIAEDIREDASKTLETLHNQGEQIHRTHQMAVTIDQDLSKGEKLLNSLGGMFSKPWKPKKTRDIKGPTITPDAPVKHATKEQKDQLMSSAPKGKSGSKTPPSGGTTAMQKVEVEKAKQDDALDDLSGILGDLKGMATDMGSELDKQNQALDHLDKDIDELNSRVKGANQRARHLLK